MVPSNLTSANSLTSAPQNGRSFAGFGEGKFFVMISSVFFSAEGFWRGIFVGRGRLRVNVIKQLLTSLVLSR